MTLSSSSSPFVRMTVVDLQARSRADLLGRKPGE